ncbi:MAG: PadR family transcriptional regulator [Pegethrix bostrychoides GSE-TBD4-15B]|jgi:DNA-binding PadR family transcriptional regulator|uniref:PadR family transcriptional regulator n=1 Tax=Pegethrix bostrychoides GSE-TBD4-15B TaxID=2839662 RepID=A0A951U7L3_9CYAN|nr:PadR family transcriptional regulator [Pegethrix bostrychoides GSE-TBD4-15B]
MSLAHVILGLLQQQERTGYDLKTKCFNDCISHLWQADQAQIYRTLDKLESQAWITCTVEIQHDRPNRKVYQITEAGEAELTHWLQTHHPLPMLREPLLVQLYFAAQLPNEAIVYLLEQELEARQEKLAQCEAQCEAIAALSLSNPTASREQKLHRLVLDLVKQREQTHLDWLEKAIRDMHTLRDRNNP